MFHRAAGGTARRIASSGAPSIAVPSALPADPDHTSARGSPRASSSPERHASSSTSVRGHADELVYIVMEVPLRPDVLQQRLDESAALPDRVPGGRCFMIQVCAGALRSRTAIVGESVQRTSKPDNIPHARCRRETTKVRRSSFVKVCGLPASPRSRTARGGRRFCPRTGTRHRRYARYMSLEQAKGGRRRARRDVSRVRHLSLHELCHGARRSAGNNAAGSSSRSTRRQPPSAIVKGLVPSSRRSAARSRRIRRSAINPAREMRVELEGLIDPRTNDNDEDEAAHRREQRRRPRRPCLQLPGFFIAFSARGHSASRPLRAAYHRPAAAW